MLIYFYINKLKTFLLRYLYINVMMLIYVISTSFIVDITYINILKKCMLTYMYINDVIVDIFLYQQYDVDISYINIIYC